MTSSRFVHPAWVPSPDRAPEDPFEECERRALHQFTAIDDCTRIRVLKIYDACNQRTAMLFIDEVLRRLQPTVFGILLER